MAHAGTPAAARWRHPAPISRPRRGCRTARHLALAFVIAVVSTACQGMGLRDTDPDHLLSRYTDERSRFIEVDGVTVHARADGEGRAILMLHGALDSLHSWEPWARHLASDYHVIRIDIPPFGLSDPMPGDDYAPENYLPIVTGVLDNYGVDNAVVVGNSLGGYFAAYYAAHEPERVRALALISPAAYPQPLPTMLRIGAMPVLGAVYEMLTPRAMVRRALRSMYGDPDRLEDEAVERRFELLRAPGNRGAARDVIRLMAERSDEEPVWIRRITQPTLLLWGEEDDWVALELAERWLQDLPDARLVTYPTVGHVAMEEIPEKSLADFRAFLSDLPDPAGGRRP